MNEQKLIAHEAAKPGLRGKINAKCIDCSYDEKSGLGNWRQQIEACPCEDCPLYGVRPRSKPQGDRRKLSLEK